MSRVTTQVSANPASDQAALIREILALESPVEDPIALLNSKGTIVAASESWLRVAQRIGAWPNQIAVGANYLDVCRRAAESSKDVRQAFDGVRSVLKGKAQFFQMDHPCSATSEQGWFRMTVSRMTYVDARFVISYSDITKPRLNSLGAKKNLRWLAARLIHAQEEERRRIARELHDDLGQRIALLSISLGQAVGNDASSSGGAERQFSDVQQRIVDIATSLRNLSHSLHPPMLENAGIGYAIESLCKDFQKTGGLKLDVHISADISKLPVEAGLCIFRITQECLQNIAKHSRSQSGCVRLERKGRQIRLIISDNGKGFVASERFSGDGLGLISIRERVRYLRGRLDIQSTPDHGTEVRVTIPAGPQS